MMDVLAAVDAAIVALLPGAFFIACAAIGLLVIIDHLRGDRE